MAFVLLLSELGRSEITLLVASAMLRPYRAAAADLPGGQTQADPAPLACLAGLGEHREQDSMGGDRQFGGPIPGQL